MDDAALVRQVLAGHSEGYGELVTRWAGRISALCHARGRSRRGRRRPRPGSAASRPGGVDFPGQPRALRALVGGHRPQHLPRLAQGQAKRGRPPSAPSAHWPRSGAFAVDPPDARLEQQDELRRLVAEVEALPEDLRTVLILYYYQDPDLS